MLFLLPIATANIGIGVSPAKRIILHVEGGNIIEENYLVYNTGDGPITANLGLEGMISNFTTVTSSSLYVEPEPQPLELPIKNGKHFKAIYHIPPSNKAQVYTGKIIASGGSAGGTLGGNVAVAMQVEIYSSATQHLWSYITKKQIIITAIILLFVVLLLLLRIYMRRKGIRITIRRKKSYYD
ncbi:hypothetical protein HZB00_02790 [Candidatus Woesearchaeota archaeon]|nr:hypothetical protein [Candidatus Woesearchaeota archaeon]